MNCIVTASGAFNAFSSIYCMLIVTSIWTCHMEFALYEFVIIFFSLLGYTGVFKKRTGDKPDGCATFFKQSKFSMVASRLISFNKEGIPLMDRDNVAVVVVLKPAVEHTENKLICVANTHLLFNKKRGDVKLGQLAFLFAELDQMSEISNTEVSHSAEVGRQRCPVILCGDFNCTPFSPLYHFVINRKLNYHGLSRIALSGQSSQSQGFPQGSLLFRNVIPWELGITLFCKKRKDTRGMEDVDSQRQRECVSEMKRSETENASGSCPGAKHSAASQMPQNPGQPLEGAQEVEVYNTSTCLEHGFELRSVYQHHFQDGQPEVTTFHDSACCTVDYVCYSAGSACQHCKVSHGQLELTGKLPLLTEGQINSLGGLPCEVLSSDHLSLGALFVFHL